jgi:hypothetical protein
MFANPYNHRDVSGNTWSEIFCPILFSDLREPSHINELVVRMTTELRDIIDTICTCTEALSTAVGSVYLVLQFYRKPEEVPKPTKKDKSRGKKKKKKGKNWIKVKR